MSLVRVCWLLAVMSCGRIGFDLHGSPTRDSSTGGDSGGSDAPVTVCVDNDGVCPSSSCVGMDNDCVNACGDTQCVGNAGETCNNCMSDCATMNPVCGNGHCDPGEDSTNCQTDCGPGPWPAAWDQNGMDLVTMISSTRTAGYTCPGGSMVTAGPIAQGPDPTEGARHLAWEIAHQMNYTGLSECNGITYIADINAAGYTSFATTQGASTPAFALSSLLSTSSSCMQVMAGGHTTASAAMAVDGVNDAWLVFFK